MYRVELKALELVEALDLHQQFLMYRVELKALELVEALDLHQQFLMYRVELKVFFLNNNLLRYGGS